MVYDDTEEETVVMAKEKWRWTKALPSRAAHGGTPQRGASLQHRAGGQDVAPANKAQPHTSQAQPPAAAAVDLAIQQSTDKPQLLCQPKALLTTQQPSNMASAADAFSKAVTEVAAAAVAETAAGTGALSQQHARRGSSVPPAAVVNSASADTRSMCDNAPGPKTVLPDSAKTSHSQQECKAGPSAGKQQGVQTSNDLQPSPLQQPPAHAADRHPADPAAAHPTTAAAPSAAADVAAAFDRPSVAAAAAAAVEDPAADDEDTDRSAAASPAAAAAASEQPSTAVHLPDSTSAAAAAPAKKRGRPPKKGKQEVGQRQQKRRAGSLPEAAVRVPGQQADQAQQALALDHSKAGVPLNDPAEVIEQHAGSNIHVSALRPNQSHTAGTQRQHKRKAETALKPIAKVLEQPADDEVKVSAQQANQSSTAGRQCQQKCKAEVAIKLAAEVSEPPADAVVAVPAQQAEQSNAAGLQRQRKRKAEAAPKPGGKVSEPQAEDGQQEKPAEHSKQGIKLGQKNPSKEQHVPDQQQKLGSASSEEQKVALKMRPSVKQMQAEHGYAPQDTSGQQGQQAQHGQQPQRGQQPQHGQQARSVQHPAMQHQPQQLPIIDPQPDLHQPKLHLPHHTSPSSAPVRTNSSAATLPSEATHNSSDVKAADQVKGVTAKLPADIVAQQADRSMFLVASGLEKAKVDQVKRLCRRLRAEHCSSVDEHTTHVILKVCPLT